MMKAKYIPPQSIEEHNKALQTKGHPVRLMTQYDSLWVKLQKCKTPEQEACILARRRFIQRLYEKLTGRYIIG